MTEPILDLLRKIRAELYAANVQRSPNDDPIIANHIYAAMQASEMAIAIARGKTNDQPH